MSNPTNLLHVIRDLLAQKSPRNALLLYNQFRRQNVCNLDVTPLIFKACSCLSLKNHGKSLHAESVKYGVDFDVMVGTSLLGMYSKCGEIVDARKVFDNMPQRNVITWNAMIAGYLIGGDTMAALSLFEAMPERTVVTWNEMIRGFAVMGDTAMARELFDQVNVEMRTVVTWTVMVDGYARNGMMEAAREVFEGMPKRNCFVWSVMINGYCKIGEVEEAKAIFYRTPVRNLVIWNSLVSGLARNGFCEDAIDAYREMQVDGFEPDEVTVTSVLSACSQLGCLDVGKEVHLSICEKGIKFNQFVLNGLVDMYAKCGDLNTARSIFEGMRQRNGTCWNSMITGFAVHGKCQEAVEFFYQMETESVKPDEISFLSVLSACAHGGLVQEGLNIFSKMEKYGVKAGVKHYGCIIDLLGRGGRLKEAFDLVKSMPMRPNDTIWGTLLGACRVHSEATLAEEALEDIVHMDSRNGSHYVLLSNIYADSDRWDKAEEIRTAMLDKGIEKTSASSSCMFGIRNSNF
ncbi:pentatricopeptide repeat-containing protein At3g21470-like [Chenopodium quinoa]|uniref:Chlororespiratory reduction 4 n=1 Tax=Chenopodium quinoa TaxID=63459 RepID=A0A803LHN4_CHEQI|nr:pentatricopeptide repeat-containing protein At3g21470-like [Chenopodium quinoa]